jgi:hypothetical protein
VFAVTSRSDVWRSGDGGRTWEEVGNVYPEALTSVKDLVVGPDGRLYVAQNQAGSGDPSNGVYRTVEPVAVASEEASVAGEAFALGAPYPNPASGAATVALILAEAAEVRVAVYDVLGREVAVLHAGPLEAGRHDLVLHGDALPSGVYAVRAENGELALTGRVTFLR